MKTVSDTARYNRELRFFRIAAAVTAIAALIVAGGTSRAGAQSSNLSVYATGS
jgi:hypothetical protein